jgi:hypothetical protein
MGGFKEDGAGDNETELLIALPDELDGLLTPTLPTAQATGSIRTQSAIADISEFLKFVKSNHQFKYKTISM